MAHARRYPMEIASPVRTAVNPDDGRSPVWLRAPSIRGALRWWFRAHRGGRLWQPDQRGGSWDALRREEGDAFGAAGSGDPQSSRILLQVEGLGESSQSTSFYAHKPSQNPTWMNKPAHLSGTFDLVARTRGFRDNAILLSQLDDAVWLWAHLGGVGLRSRRAYGSVGLREERHPSADALEGALKAGLQRRVGRGAGALAGGERRRPPFPILHPQAARVGLLARDGQVTFKTFGDAQKALMEALRPFSHPPATGAGHETWAVPAFGTGNSARYRGADGKMRGAKKTGLDRVASPLQTHVHLLQGGGVCLAITSFCFQLDTLYIDRQQVDLNDGWADVDAFWRQHVKEVW